MDFQQKLDVARMFKKFRMLGKTKNKKNKEYREEQTIQKKKKDK
jgi:hypothetical protein